MIATSKNLQMFHVWLETGGDDEVNFLLVRFRVVEDECMMVPRPGSRFRDPRALLPDHTHGGFDHFYHMPARGCIEYYCGRGPSTSSYRYQQHRNK